MTTRRIIGPFNRVEGDLEVEIEVAGGEVAHAWVNSPLYRGFEQILLGKDPRDALVYTPRICGICSVAQSVAAAQALAQAQNFEPAPNGRLATNLMLACENMADHLTHFYLFFMPDFARSDYANAVWYEAIAQRFRAQSGQATREVMAARAKWLHITGILAGKWPHTLSVQPGGSTRAVEAQERVRLFGIIGAFREFLENVVFGDELENVTALDSETALKNWLDSRGNHSDFSRFLRLSDQLQLHKLGRANDHFMSYGAYPDSPSSHLFAQGTWQNGQRATLDTDAISEDISHSWMLAQNGPRHPYEGSTIPDEEMSAGYSWCKAPRLNGQVCEVGALARQVVNGHPLVLDAVRHSGGNVRTRVMARLMELALVVPVMEQWVRELVPGEAFCAHAPMPDECQGAGLIEAARGSLGHWLRVKNGHILNYQIIAPTTWNFSPRDSASVPGALEQALSGTPVGHNGTQSVNVQHIVRSFDPCMVCTVH